MTTKIKSPEIATCPLEEEMSPRLVFGEVEWVSGGFGSLGWTHGNRKHPMKEPMAPSFRTLGRKGISDEGDFVTIFVIERVTRWLPNTHQLLASSLMLREEYPQRGSHAPSTQKHYLMPLCMGLPSMRRQPAGGEKAFVLVLEQVWEHSEGLPSMAADSHTLSRS
jgi:hypothetical protein